MSIQANDRGETDYAAVRARLGFAVTSKPRVRLDLIRPRKVAVRAPLLEPTARPVSPLLLLDRYGWPKYLEPLFYDAFTPTSEPPKKSWRQIAREVCSKHQVTMLDLLSQRRHAAVARARQEAFYRCRHETTLSLASIGRLIGNRDHTTVLHGIKVHARRLAEAKYFTGGGGW